MTPEVPPLRTLPDPVHQTLSDFEKNFSLRFQLFQEDERGEAVPLYATPSLDQGTGVEGVGGVGGVGLSLIHI